MGGTNDAERFIIGSLTKGLDLFMPDISAEVSWDEETYNISTAVRNGAAVRYGVAPLPGHNNTLAPVDTGSNGLQYAEAISGTTQSLEGRRRVYAVYWLESLRCYAWVVSATNPAPEHFDVVISTVFSGSRVFPTPGIHQGVGRTGAMSGFAGLVRSYTTELLSLESASTPTVSTVATLFANSSVWRLSTAHFRTPKKLVAYTGLAGREALSPTVNTSGSYALDEFFPTAGLGSVYLGAPSRSMLANYPPNDQRVITYWVLDGDGATLNMRYRPTEPTTDAIATASVLHEGPGATYLELPAAIKSGDLAIGGGGTAYGSAAVAYIEDPSQQTDAGHDVIMVCADRPFAVLYEKGLSQTDGMLPRYMDLTRPGMTPRKLGQLIDSNGATYSSVLFASALLPQTFTLGGSGTGFFRQNTAYRLGVAYYNKRLDYETNVEIVAAFKSATLDNFCVGFPASLDGAAIVLAGVTLFSTLAGATPNHFPFDFSTTNTISGYPKGQGLHINDYSYRFYYQEAGQGEWLPLEEFDAAAFWFNPVWTSTAMADPAGDYFRGPTVGVGAVGRATGGSPNGFNDYSPLPPQTYLQTLVFRSRIFWFAVNDFRFSYENRPYQYPLGNIVTAKGGQWRGAIEYTREKETNTQAVLFVFASDSCFLATFTGVRIQRSVRVSAETTERIDVDGSDFQLNPLANVTAFSFRSAVNARGTLYFWGPQGIYAYAGSGMPAKISDILDDGFGQGIAQWVNPANYADVVCTYNSQTQEVLWFYPPATSDSEYPTRVLSYDTRANKFSIWKLPTVVRDCQKINIEDSASYQEIMGERVLIFASSATVANITRPYFFDHRVRAGDQAPDRQLAISVVATPSTGVRRLTLASGSIGVTAGGIAVDDFLELQNTVGYAPSLTTTTDMLAKIIAVDNAAATIDIELPTDGVLANFTGTSLTSFPVWHRKLETPGLHGIPWVLCTNYWLPNGVANSYVWEYLYFLFKYEQWPQPVDPLNTPYNLLAQFLHENRTPVCDGYTGDYVRLLDNSDGHCQVHYRVPNENRSANGQALKQRMTGIALGDPWVLEYLEAHCMLEQGFTLKEFQI